MAFRVQFRPYRLPLRVAVRTARETWTERRGFLVRADHEGGSFGFGEVAPIPGFGTETAEIAEAALRALGEWPSDAELGAVPLSLACVRHALSAAVGAARHGSSAGEGSAPAAVETGADRAYLPVAALLPAGRAALAQLPGRLEMGFRSFKWKVGVGDIADELSLLDDVCSALPSGAKLRLDANGAWERRHAERWLERCAERPIEFVEQPCFAAKVDGATTWRRAEDVLLGLAHDYPVPLALDESVMDAGDVERWLGAGWPGWFVIKPTLLADPEAVLQRLAAARATVVFSSALETAVGAAHALRLAFRWSGEAKALGFGVWPLFTDARFDGPAAAPFIRREDVARLDPEALWNALG